MNVRRIDTALVTALTRGRLLPSRAAGFVSKVSALLISSVET
ncbi:hypothetical protein Z946_2262 [Sulfitobacter noctilucicola]|nr:hypothetical protein Z946_2262 [Sulfitobacter noctilucicola]